MKKIKQAKIPKGMVKLAVLGSNKENGHLKIVGVMPTYFAADIVKLIIERSNQWKESIDEYNKTRREKRLWNKTH